MSYNKLNKHPSKTVLPTLFKRCVTWYSSKLQTNPLMTKAITSGFIAGAGDLTCQYIVHIQQLQEQQELQQLQLQPNITTNQRISFGFEPDLIRTSRFTFLGFALIAPVVHVSTL
jgi:hypothetical protein